MDTEAFQIDTWESADFLRLSPKQSSIHLSHISNRNHKPEIPQQQQQQLSGHDGDNVLQQRKCRTNKGKREVGNNVEMGQERERRKVPSSVTQTPPLVQLPVTEASVSLNDQCAEEIVRNDTETRISDSETSMTDTSSNGPLRNHAPSVCSYPLVPLLNVATTATTTNSSFVKSPQSIQLPVNEKICWTYELKFPNTGRQGGLFVVKEPTGAPKPVWCNWNIYGGFVPEGELQLYKSSILKEGRQSG